MSDMPPMTEIKLVYEKSVSKSHMSNAQRGGSSSPDKRAAMTKSRSHVSSETGGPGLEAIDNNESRIVRMTDPWETTKGYLTVAGVSCEPSVVPQAQGKGNETSGNKAIVRLMSPATVESGE